MQLPTIVLSGICASAMLATSGISAAQQKQTQQDKRDEARAAQVARLSQLMKASVETPQGQALGKIEDFAVHQPSGQAVYAIISTNGIRGLNNERRAVPVEALEIDRGQGPVKIDTTLDRFGDAPTFSSEGWTTVGDARWGKIVHQHYGLEFDISDFTLSSDDDQKPSQVSMVQATRLLDMDLENRQDQDLGDVEDLAIDLKTGRVMYVIVDDAPVGEDRLVAIPWQAIQRASQEDALVVNMQRDRLREAPSFEEDRWPNLASGNFSNQVHEFYGTNSDWVYGSDEPQRDRDDRQPSRNGESDDGHGWLPQDKYGQQFNRDAIETIRGEVVERRFFTPMPGMARGVMLRVRGDNGQTFDVHLGPAWYINRQQGNFRQGDQVEVTGSRILGESGPAFMAVEVRRDDSSMYLRERNGLPMWDAWRGSQYVDSQNGDQ